MAMSAPRSQAPTEKPRARCRDDERQSDERADADHLQHVEEDGGAQADAPLKILFAG